MSIGSSSPCLRKVPRTCRDQRAESSCSFWLRLFVLWAALFHDAHAQITRSTANVQTVAGRRHRRIRHLPTIIGRIIYVALSLVGIVLLGLLLYAGFMDDG